MLWKVWFLLCVFFHSFHTSKISVQWAWVSALLWNLRYSDKVVSNCLYHSTNLISLFMTLLPLNLNLQNARLDGCQLAVGSVLPAICCSKNFYGKGQTNVKVALIIPAPVISSAPSSPSYHSSEPYPWFSCLSRWPWLFQQQLFPLRPLRPVINLHLILDFLSTNMLTPLELDSFFC